MVKLIISEEDNKKSKIIFEGELTINNIEETKQIIDKAFNDLENLEIECKNVESIDLTYLQLFYAMYKTAKQENKLISFSFDFSHEHQNLIKIIGFDAIIKEITNS